MNLPRSSIVIRDLQAYKIGYSMIDVAARKEEAYEPDWDLPAKQEIITKCEDQDGCPALKGQVYTGTLKLKLLDAVGYNVTSGMAEPTGKKEKRWVMVALEKNK